MFLLTSLLSVAMACGGTSGPYSLSGGGSYKTADPMSSAGMGFAVSGSYETLADCAKAGQSKANEFLSTQTEDKQFATLKMWCTHKDTKEDTFVVELTDL